LALFGATIGSVLDGFHTWSGTTAYPEPVLLRAAWWTPLIFAGAYTLEGVLYTVARQRSGKPAVAPAVRWTCALLFAGLYAASGFLPVANPIKLAVLLGGFVALWAATDRTPQTLAVAAAAAVLGPVTEITLVHLGLFAHLQPDLAGIPMWLPGLYLCSAPGIGPMLDLRLPLPLPLVALHPIP
jgi:energy-converting hydrogenase Eha subunit C